MFLNGTNVVEDILVHDSKLKNNANTWVVFMNSRVPGRSELPGWTLLYSCLATKCEGRKKHGGPEYWGFYTRVFPLMTHVNCMHCLPEIPWWHILHHNQQHQFFSCKSMWLDMHQPHRVKQCNQGCWPWLPGLRVQKGQPYGTGNFYSDKCIHTLHIKSTKLSNVVVSTLEHKLTNK